jgi:hypothetical protein
LLQSTPGRNGVHDASYIKTAFPRHNIHILDMPSAARDAWRMITAPQMRAARALLGLDQRQLAALACVSLPTIQRMEASKGTVRGNVETLTKVVDALDRAGVVLIRDHGATAEGGRGVRFKEPRG